MNVPTLTELSPNDQKFIEKRDQTEKLSRLLANNGYKELSDKFRQCGTFLEFRISGEGELKLHNANFCKSALCPMCSWRRSRRWRKRLKEGASQIQGRWIFLTLTIKNRPITDLKHSLDQLNQGWQELEKSSLKEFLNGYVRVIEITRSLPPPESNEEICHPHIHALLNIEPKYFSDYYLTHCQWREAWKQSIKAEYLPIINIKAVRHISPRILGEIAKYTLKPGSFLEKYKRDKRRNIVGINWPGTNPDQQKADFFAELCNQIYHRRLISTGGIIKSKLKGNEEDLIGGRGGHSEHGENIQFIWRKQEDEWPNYYAN